MEYIQFLYRIADFDIASCENTIKNKETLSVLFGCGSDINGVYSYTLTHLFFPMQDETFDIENNRQFKLCGCKMCRSKTAFFSAIKNNSPIILWKCHH